MLQTKATAPEGQILSDHEIPMYDELWTAARAMYKLEPAVATDGEVVIYAPHLDTVSHVHGKYICEVGYHILPYFLKDCARLNLGYLDPAKVNPEEWKAREREGVLYVPKAGEILNRLKH